MSVSLHPIEQIVNVSWGGGIFAAARKTIGRQNPCAIVYGKAGAKIDWQALGAFGIGEAGGLVGCSVGGKKTNDDGTTTGVTTFVMVGTTFKEPDFGSIFLTSTDGKKWDVTRERMDPTRYSLEHGTGVVWDDDEGAFYASCFAREGGSGELASYSERLYRSVTGYSWALAKETAIDATTDPNTIDSTLLQYCNKPENKGGIDSSFQPARMPDGLQAYNKNADVFMRPKDLKRFGFNGTVYLYSGEAVSPTITIRRPNDDEESGGYIEEDKNIGSPCFAVANVGSAWVAGGFKSKLEVSFDKGQNWDPSYDHTGDTSTKYDISTIIGGNPDKS